MSGKHPRNNGNNKNFSKKAKTNNVNSLRIRTTAPTIKNGRSKIWVPEGYWAHPNSEAARKLGLPTPRNKGTPYPNFYFNNIPKNKEKKNRKTRKARKNIR